MPEQIVGYEDIVGDDDEVSGTVSNGQRRILAKNLPQSFVGIPTQTIGASAANVGIQVPVLRNIRPDRLVIDRVQAASLNVNNIAIGTISLNASANPVPADMFAPDAVGTSIRFLATASPSVGITLTVTNRTATAVTNFSAGFIGPSTDPT